LRLFGQLETAVMQVLWRMGRPAVVREVLDELQRDRNLAYTTVMTVMDNLFHKGILERELDGRAYRYRPLRTREQHTADLMEEVLSGSGDSAATLMHFVEQMPAQEVAQLRDVLDRRSSADTGPQQ
jgi:predicted transcriptional regulator